MKKFILLTLMLRVWWGPLEPYMAVEPIGGNPNYTHRVYRERYVYSGVLLSNPGIHAYDIFALVRRDDGTGLETLDLKEIKKTQWVNIQAEP